MNSRKLEELRILREYLYDTEIQTFNVARDDLRDALDNLETDFSEDNIKEVETKVIESLPYYLQLVEIYQEYLKEKKKVEVLEPYIDLVERLLFIREILNNPAFYQTDNIANLDPAVNTKLREQNLSVEKYFSPLRDTLNNLDIKTSPTQSDLDNLEDIHTYAKNILHSKLYAHLMKDPSSVLVENFAPAIREQKAFNNTAIIAKTFSFSAKFLTFKGRTTPTAPTLIDPKANRLPLNTIPEEEEEKSTSLTPPKSSKS